MRCAGEEARPALFSAAQFEWAAAPTGRSRGRGRVADGRDDTGGAREVHVLFCRVSGRSIPVFAVYLVAAKHASLSNA